MLRLMEDGRGEFIRMNREEKMKDMRERLPFADEENKDGRHERERGTDSRRLLRQRCDAIIVKLYSGARP